MRDARRSLELYANRLEKRVVNERARARHAEIMEANMKHPFFARDTSTAVNKTHHASLKVSPNTPESDLFSTNSVCILASEGEVGPFWVKCELIRSDVRDGEPGIPIILDGQFIDINTCEPIEDLYWDIWNCNFTGLYSGSSKV